MATPITPRYTATCPRCDVEFSGSTQKEAFAEVRAHLLIQEDQVHDGALEEWDDLDE